MPWAPSSARQRPGEAARCGARAAKVSDDVTAAVARARIAVARGDPGPEPPLGPEFAASDTSQKRSKQVHKTKVRGQAFSEQEWMAVTLTWADTVNSCHCSETQLGSRNGCIDWPLLDAEQKLVHFVPKAAADTPGNIWRHWYGFDPDDPAEPTIEGEDSSARALRRAAPLAKDLRIRNETWWAAVKKAGILGESTNRARHFISCGKRQSTGRQPIYADGVGVARPGASPSCTVSIGKPYSSRLVAPCPPQARSRLTWTSTPGGWCWWKCF